MYTVILKKDGKVVKQTPFEILFLAIKTFTLWDRKFSIEKGFYVLLERN